MMTRKAIAMTSPMTITVCQAQRRLRLMTKPKAGRDKPDQRRILLCLL